MQLLIKEYKSETLISLLSTYIWLYKAATLCSSVSTVPKELYKIIVNSN